MDIDMPRLATQRPPPAAPALRLPMACLCIGSIKRKESHGRVGADAGIPDDRCEAETKQEPGDIQSLMDGHLNHGWTSRGQSATVSCTPAVNRGDGRGLFEFWRGDAGQPILESAFHKSSPGFAVRFSERDLPNYFCSCSHQEYCIFFYFCKQYLSF